jgi:MarR family transcriptional regulator for hemolysin
MRSTEISESFGLLLAETARVWRSKLDQRLRPLGLSQAQWVALVHLSKAQEPITQRELAERVGIEGPTLVRLLDRMSRDGWIERRESSQDRRSKTVHPTERARAILSEIYTIAAQLRSELLRDVPAAQLQACGDVLRRINAAAQAL